MASIRKDPDGSGRWRVQFRFGGKQYQRSLRTTSEAEAEAIRGRVEETIALVVRGRLVIPEGADVGAWVVSDGKLGARPDPAPKDNTPRPVTLGELIAKYEESPPPAKEANWLKVERSYLRNVARVLGEDKAVETIGLPTINGYARKRLAEPKRPKPYTIRKEAKTLRYLWTWGVKAGHVASGPAWKPADVELPKDEQRGRFLTRGEIEARIARGGIGDGEEKALWANLVLMGGELQDVLQVVEAAGLEPWLHPAVCFAGMTGARRSEILRSRVDDFDFEAGKVFIREKKRDTRVSITARAVDLHPEFARVMAAWLADHPGGQHVIATADGRPPTVDQMDNRLAAALRGSRWEKIRGWHVFRHSFCSILASNGVDQRVIDAFVGHQTEEMRRRYRHLFPATLRSAILTLLPGESGGAGRDS